MSCVARRAGVMLRESILSFGVIRTVGVYG